MSHLDSLDPLAAELLDYWFADIGDDASRALTRLQLWFESTPADDAEMRARFGAAVAPAQAGELDAWAATPLGRLALVLVLDQLPRNLHRGSAEAFAGDAAGLAHAQAAFAAREDAGLSIPQRVFLAMPFEHAELPDAQAQCVEVFSELHETAPAEWRSFTQQCVDAAHEHRNIIVRFGRFPHRNAALRRADTAAEAAYLASGARRFGQ